MYISLQNIDITLIKILSHKSTLEVQRDYSSAANVWIENRSSGVTSLSVQCPKAGGLQGKQRGLVWGGGVLL